MRVVTIIALALLLTGCRVYPAQYHAVQPEVVTNYTWWNNLVERPVAYIEVYNTTGEAFEAFTLNAKAFDESDNVIGAFDVHKAFVLNPGERRSFRIALPGRKAKSVKVYMVGYDGVLSAAPDQDTEVLVSESEGDRYEVIP